MIDFAQCRLRREDEDDELWKQAKWSEDEEGAVGYVLKKFFLDGTTNRASSTWSLLKTVDFSDRYPFYLHLFSRQLSATTGMIQEAPLDLKLQQPSSTPLRPLTV